MGAFFCNGNVTHRSYEKGRVPGCVEGDGGGGVKVLYGGGPPPPTRTLVARVMKLMR